MHVPESCGFFRFPARITTRIACRPTPASWVEHLERSAARERFLTRHLGTVPAKAAPPAHVLTARITLRV